MAPRARFELATLRLTAECSTVELPGNGPTQELHYKQLSGFCANLLPLRFGSIWFQQGNFIAVAVVILQSNNGLQLRHFACIVGLPFRHVALDHGVGTVSNPLADDREGHAGIGQIADTSMSKC